jgi:primosomal protein N' (replication factor Y)
MLRYPPFGRLARIVLEGEQGATERRARQASERLRSAAGSLADAAGDSLAVLGPAPAPIERLRGRFRMQLLVKARDARKMGRILAMADLHGTTAVRTIVDVDPISML